MNRVILIGIDGMDYAFAKANMDRLPGLKSLSQNGFFSTLKSVFPPDSIPSWITVYTGMEPDEHGIVQSIDYLKKDYRKFKINTGIFQGNTFWDVASKAGKRVCIINPLMAYPVWPVNGIMINGPIFISGEIQAYPPEIIGKYHRLPPLGGIVDFPKKKTLKRFIEKTVDDTRQLARYALEVFSSEKWDLFFISFFTLDRLQHFLWRFSDETDSTYPGLTEYKNSIIELYKEYDEIISGFTKYLYKDDLLLAISDHGHGMRCTRMLNLNEFLRKRGYLNSTTGSFPLLNKNYWIEKVKNISLQFLFSLRMEEYTYHLVKFVRDSKKLKTSDYVVSKDGSIAYLSDFAGMGPYGGIVINQELRQNNSYEKTCQSIINELSDLNESCGGRLFKWIEKRNVLFSGEKKSVYPDILFELGDNLGVNWGLYMPLITRNPFHRRISGGHNMNGILASNNPHFLNADKLYQVKDIKQIVLKALEIYPSES